MNKNMFNKFKQIMSKYDTLILFAFLLICSIGPILYIQVSVSDEIWNFQNVLKLFNGLEIYKDANIIITPLFYYIAIIFCKIFGGTLITFKIYNVFLTAILSILVYKLFTALKVTKLKSSIYSLIIYILIIYLATYGANYNVLSAIFFLVGVLLSIKELRFNSKAYNFLQAFMIFLIFLTKQNIAVYYTIALIIVEFILCKKRYKNFFVSVLTKIIITLVFISMFLIVISYKGQLNNFINYTVLGIPEFASNLAIQINTLINLGVVFTISVIAIMSILYKNNSIQIDSEIKVKIIKLLVFGLFMQLTAYPIFNIYHSMLGAIVIYILGFYLIDIIFISNFIKTKKYLFGIMVVITILIYIYSMYNLINYIKYMKFDRSEDITVFKNTIVSEETKEKISVINKYIKDKEKIGINVIIFSQDAAIYMIPLNKNNQAMDLPFLGNMGADGENNMLEKIKSLKNNEIMIVKDEKEVFWQESKLVRKYIIDNFNCIGEIENFKIYVL